MIISLPSRAIRHTIHAERLIVARRNGHKNASSPRALLPEKPSWIFLVPLTRDRLHRDFPNLENRRELNFHNVTSRTNERERKREDSYFRFNLRARRESSRRKNFSLPTPTSTRLTRGEPQSYANLEPPQRKRGEGSNPRTSRQNRHRNSTRRTRHT